MIVLGEIDDFAFDLCRRRVIGAGYSVRRLLSFPYKTAITGKYWWRPAFWGLLVAVLARTRSPLVRPIRRVDPRLHDLRFDRASTRLINPSTSKIISHGHISQLRYRWRFRYDVVEGFGCDKTLGVFRFLDHVPVEALIRYWTQSILHTLGCILRIIRSVSDNKVVP